jgi:hypothetical protein
VALGLTSMICFPFYRFDLKSEYSSDSEASSQPLVTIWNDNLQFFAKGFYGIHTTFMCPSSTSHYPYWVVAWNGCPKSDHIFLFPTSVVRNLQIQALASSS